ncbi:MAG TPA: hypothetical protein VK843_21040 [Planctomycetota bacterium]|nr:hypothetical protein [Planctomycetota bacterium]
MDSTERRFPPASAIAVTFAAGFFAACATVYLLGGFGHFLLSAVALTIAVPAVLILSVTTILVDRFAPARRRAMNSLLNFVSWPIAFTAAQIPGLFVGLSITSWQVTQAKQWCDGLAPELEAFRARTGEYPSELEKLGIGLRPPKMCRQSLLYQATPMGYALDFADEASWLSGYAYSSERGTWSHYD